MTTPIESEDWAQAGSSQQQPSQEVDPQYTISNAVRRDDFGQLSNGFTYQLDADIWCYLHHDPHHKRDCNNFFSSWDFFTQPHGWKEVVGENYSTMLTQLPAPVTNLHEYSTLMQYHFDLVMGQYHGFVKARDALYLSIGRSLSSESLTASQLKMWFRLIAISNCLAYRAVHDWLVGINDIRKHYMLRGLEFREPNEVLTDPNGWHIRSQPYDAGLEFYRKLAVLEPTQTQFPYQNDAYNSLVERLNSTGIFIDDQKRILSGSLITYLLVRANRDIASQEAMVKAFRTCLKFTISVNETANRWGIRELRFPSLV